MPPTANLSPRALQPYATFENAKRDAPELAPAAPAPAPAAAAAAAYHGAAGSPACSTSGDVARLAGALGAASDDTELRQVPACCVPCDADWLTCRPLVAKKAAPGGGGGWGALCLTEQRLRRCTEQEGQATSGAPDEQHREEQPEQAGGAMALSGAFFAALERSESVVGPLEHDVAALGSAPADAGDKPPRTPPAASAGESPWVESGGRPPQSRSQTAALLGAKRFHHHGGVVVSEPVSLARTTPYAADLSVHTDAGGGGGGGGGGGHDGRDTSVHSSRGLMRRSISRLGLIRVDSSRHSAADESMRLGGAELGDVSVHTQASMTPSWSRARGTAGWFGGDVSVRDASSRGGKALSSAPDAPDHFQTIAQFVLSQGKRADTAGKSAPRHTSQVASPPFPSQPA